MRSAIERTARQRWAKEIGNECNKRRDEEEEGVVVVVVMVVMNELVIVVCV